MMTTDAIAAITAALQYDIPIADCETTTVGALRENYPDVYPDDSSMADDDVALVLPGWVAEEYDSEASLYPHAANATEAANEYVTKGDWGADEITETAWVSIRTYKEAVTYTAADGTTKVLHFRSDTKTTAIDPLEPDCEEGYDHDWQSPWSIVGGIEENPGVMGHGGGVIITEVCAHCGTYRTTDSWAQNMDTGEQGLKEISYREADEISLAWVEERNEDDNSYCL